MCGDHYQAKTPRYVHPRYKEKYRVITTTYREGQTFTAKVKITASYRGFFEFRVGKLVAAPMTNMKLTHLLELENGGTRWKLGPGTRVFTVRLKLPRGLVYDHCVMQWWWKDGNSWGCDENVCGIANGLQEAFVNCADIRILPRDGIIPPEPPTQPPRPPTQTTKGNNTATNTTTKATNTTS